MTVTVRRWTPRREQQLHPTCAVCDRAIWEHYVEQSLHPGAVDLPCPTDQESDT